MCYACNEKWEKRGKKGTNSITKSGTYENRWRKGKLLVHGNIRSEHHQASGDEEKIRKDNIKRIRKLLESRRLIKWINTGSIFFIMIIITILKIDKGELWQIDQRTRKLMTIHKILHLGDDIDCTCQEKKKEEDWVALRVGLIYHYKNSRNTRKRTKKDWLF